MVTDEQFEKVEAVIAAEFDHAPDEGYDALAFAKAIARALADAGMLAGTIENSPSTVAGEWVQIPADQSREEWAAVVGWRNEHGQTEQNQGYGDTREAALADARSQPRLLGLGDEDEAAHKALRRFVSSWEEA
ncbi:hypothetical protein AB0331_13985 [Dietzia maris]|uniref:hypothetical protein n=1 Tax=Dietzia maris TaxID=37915 RepID=UPI0034510749